MSLSIKSLGLLVVALAGCSDGPTKTGATNNGSTAGTNNQTIPNATNNASAAGYRLRTTYVLGDEPRRPVIANLDGDRFPDVVIVNQFSADTQFFFGNGDGAFREDGDSLERATSVVAADFDGSGIDDIAISVDGESRVEIVLDPGATPFHISLSVTALPDGLAVADFDGDGDIDLAVSLAGTENEPGSSVAVFPWGDSTFGPETLASIGLQPRALQVIDDDLVVLLGTKSAIMLQNNGAGSFAASAPFGLGDGVINFAILDLDGSGTPDVIAADLLGGALMAALDLPANDADRLIAMPSPYGITLLRANDDETPDIAITSVDDATVVGLLSKPDGTYARTVLATLDGAVRLGDIVAADLDGDGLDDLLVVERGRDTPGTLHVFVSSPLPTR